MTKLDYKPLKTILNACIIFTCCSHKCLPSENKSIFDKSNIERIKKYKEEKLTAFEFIHLDDLHLKDIFLLPTKDGIKKIISNLKLSDDIEKIFSPFFLDKLSDKEITGLEVREVIDSYIEIYVLEKKREGISIELIEKKNTWIKI